LEHDKKTTSPLLYHLNFILGLVEGAFHQIPQVEYAALVSLSLSDVRLESPLMSPIGGEYAILIFNKTRIN
jgi:hypothetical protein